MAGLAPAQSDAPAAKGLTRRCNLTGCGFVVILSTDDSNRRFKFNKRSQLFIRTHNETLSVAAIGVRNEDCLHWSKRKCFALTDQYSLISYDFLQTGG